MGAYPRHYGNIYYLSILLLTCEHNWLPARYHSSVARGQSPSLWAWRSWNHTLGRTIRMVRTWGRRQGLLASVGAPSLEQWPHCCPYGRNRWELWGLGGYWRQLCVCGGGGRREGEGGRRERERERVREWEWCIQPSLYIQWTYNQQERLGARVATKVHRNLMTSDTQSLKGQRQAPCTDYAIVLHTCVGGGEGCRHAPSNTLLPKPPATSHNICSYSVHIIMFLQWWWKWYGIQHHLHS